MKYLSSDTPRHAGAESQRLSMGMSSSNPSMKVFLTLSMLFWSMAEGMRSEDPTAIGGPGSPNLLRVETKSSWRSGCSTVTVIHRLSDTVSSFSCAAAESAGSFTMLATGVATILSTIKQSWPATRSSARRQRLPMMSSVPCFVLAACSADGWTATGWSAVIVN